MDKHDKDRLAWEAKRRHQFQRLKNGALSVLRSKAKLIALLVYLVAAAVVYVARDSIFPAEGAFASLHRLMLPVAVVAVAVIGLFGLLLLFGSPWGGSRVNAGMFRAGLKNHAGETPLLLDKRKDKNKPYVVVFEFDANGVPISVWRDRQAYLESALDVNIIKITQGKNKQRVVVYAVPAATDLPDRVGWKSDYLSQDTFVLKLGVGLLGSVEVNVAVIPHILLGGSTGSGKSVMLKLLLMQFVEKGAKVYIADFKGGVDFSGPWASRCRLVVDVDTLLDVLDTITGTMPERMERLLAAGCANIDQYNKIAFAPMQRIALACDEVAAMLDKTGQSKGGKEKIAKVEGMLADIARLGRALGIHLVLATQRPDANILNGQIRNNLDCRICGRADDVLSKIILDNTEASDKIPKDAQGRFLLHDGTLLQGYWFDDTSW